MERRVRPEDFQLPEQAPSATSTIVYGFLLLWVLHQALVYFDFPILSPRDLFWNALVYATPSRLLLDAAQRQQLEANNMISQGHAAKSEALRKVFGMGSRALVQQFPGLQELSGASIVRRASIFPVQDGFGDAPPGLGNWDNSCYQNSVLQGLASLKSFRSYLDRPTPSEAKMEVDAGSATDTSTQRALAELVSRLNDRSNNGRHLWTPAKLKNMSSWQQQDAQEYFSKIMDELDKEAAKFVSKHHPNAGLENLPDSPDVNNPHSAVPSTDTRSSILQLLRNPLEGLLAQRVACTRCGFSEGLSMIPFNCLTLPLGSDFAYDLEECLDEYTELENIAEVECAKCTLLHAEAQYKQMMPAGHLEPHCGPEATPRLLILPPELREMAAKRLKAIQQALEDDDFSDKTVNEICHIPKKAHVSSTKTRQAVVGRPPQSLVVHVNRSVFDESTGIQRKNYASVRYPMKLDLRPWMLDEDCEQIATQSMLTNASGSNFVYHLKAVVTHYGRHENGHYVCYRQHPFLISEGDSIDRDKAPKEELQWWRLSDEDVALVAEADVLTQGGVFMLFYERDQEVQVPKHAGKAPTELMASHHAEAGLEMAAAVPLPADTDIEEEGVAALAVPSDSPDLLENGSARLTLACMDKESQQSSTETTVEGKPETDCEEKSALREPAKSSQKARSPSLMRTARGNETPRRENGFDTGFRAVAAN